MKDLKSETDKLTKLSVTYCIFWTHLNVLQFHKFIKVYVKPDSQSLSQLSFTSHWHFLVYILGKAVMWRWNKWPNMSSSTVKGFRSPPKYWNHYSKSNCRISPALIYTVILLMGQLLKLFFFFFSPNALISLKQSKIMSAVGTDLEISLFKYLLVLICISVHVCWKVVLLVLF